MNAKRSPHTPSLVLALGLLGAVLLGSCSDGDPSSAGAALKARTGGPRLVVLFAVCTLNKDYISPYNPEVKYTPTLQQLADAGVVFDKQHTEAGQSGTAYASLFSGCQADGHKIYTHPNELDDRMYLMAEAFRDSGWTPWYWFGHPMADPKNNYAQGVAPEHVVSFKTKNPSVARLTPNDPELVGLLRELAANPELHAQITINFSYTHGPYTEGRQRSAYDGFKRAYPDEVPFSYAEMERLMAIWLEDRHQLQWNFPETKARLGLSDEDVANIAAAIELAYKSGIYLLDTQIAFFLRTVQQEGLQDELLFAFTADHGQVLFRESALFQWTHGLQLAPEVLNVPLIVFAPKLLSPGRYAGVSRSIDVYPTLAGLAGVKLPDGAPVAGYDLSNALLGAEAPPDLIAFSHSTTISPKMFDKTCDWSLFHTLFPSPEPESLWVGARKGDLYFKWRTLEDESWTAEAFDMVSDPDERTNLFDAAKADHAAMLRELQAYKERLVRGFPSVDGPEDALDALRDMGYIGDDEGDDENESK